MPHRDPAMHNRFIVAHLERAIFDTETAMRGIDDAAERNALMMGIVAHKSLVAKYLQIETAPAEVIAHDP